MRVRVRDFRDDLLVKYTAVVDAIARNLPVSAIVARLLGQHVGRVLSVPTDEIRGILRPTVAVVEVRGRDVEAAQEATFCEYLGQGSLGPLKRSAVVARRQ